MKLELKHELPYELDVIGSVNNAIQGNVPKYLKGQKFNASDYSFGFNLASPNSIESMGESVIVNNKCYANDSDPNSLSYNTTISGESFFTSAMLTLPRDTKENYILSLSDSSNEISYYALLKNVFDKVKKPFVLVAHVSFKSLHATAISKAPIYNKNIFENKDEYYCMPEAHLKSTHAFIIACIADFSLVDNVDLYNGLELVLYNNPMDKKQSLNIHTHAITLKNAIESYEEITPKIVDKTLHVFSEQTVIQALKGEVYMIRGLRSI